MELDQARARRARRRRRGFTLLEMMAVIAIIGILAAFLIPNVMDAFRGATTSACEANMRELYRYLVQYRSSHNMSWPKEEGQRFLLRLWKDEVMEHSEQNAKRLFCPNNQYDNWKQPDEVRPALEYLNDWENVGPGFLSYAGFTSNGDPKLRAQLNNNPAKVTIAADVIPHRNELVYMTADGNVHRLQLAELVDQGILTQEQVDNLDIPIGPSSPIEVLRTVTNDI